MLLNAPREWSQEGMAPALGVEAESGRQVKKHPPASCTAEPAGNQCSKDQRGHIHFHSIRGFPRVQGNPAFGKAMALIRNGFEKMLCPT